MGRVHDGVMMLALLLTAGATCADELQAMTTRYCTQCHNAADWAGGLDLELLDAEQVGHDAEAWKRWC